MRQPRPPKDIPPPLELECLKALWSLGEGNVRAVQQQMEPQRKLAYTTVMTLLERLVRKGGVARRKAGRAFVYSPVLDKESLRRKAIQELTENLFDGSPALLLSYLKEGQGSALAAAAAAVSVPAEVVQMQEERLDATLL